MRTFLRRWCRLALGVLLGSFTALAGLGFALAGGVWLAARPSGTAVSRGARRLAEVERRRMAAWYGDGDGTELAPPRPEGGPLLGYLALRAAIGLLGGLVLACVAAGVGYASMPLWLFVLSDVEYPFEIFYTAGSGLFLLFLCAQAVFGVALLDEQLARRFLGPNRQALLERRIGELAESRAGVVEAVHEERRRIERDLHDGVQQRLVALGMLLGRARRSDDPEKAGLLLAQAHRESGEALAELREVAWRVYPAALDEGGLGEALETIAERAAIPVRLHYELSEPPPTIVQGVAYFVAAEAVTNAVKHSGASLVTVRAARRDDVVLVRVEDNGSGGAGGSGSGLLGLSRRVAALDGRLSIDSPAGGPTVITAELPCG
jgi:signal transduction histidine kinase